MVHTFPAFCLCLLLSLPTVMPLWANEMPVSKDLPTRQPNILFLLADDLGYGDLGCYGRTDLHTPALDHLARQGVRFTAHYSNGAECTPTRAALISGQYPQRLPVWNARLALVMSGGTTKAAQLAEVGQLGLRVMPHSLPKLLQQAGYATALCGKWHLGYRPQFSPQAHGFEFALECAGGEMDYFHHAEKAGNRVLKLNAQPVRRAGYFTDLVTNSALEFIETHGSRPWFIYASFTAPHAPYQGPNDFRELPLPADSPLWNQSQAPPETYRAMIEHLDRDVVAAANPAR